MEKIRKESHLRVSERERRGLAEVLRNQLCLMCFIDKRSNNKYGGNMLFSMSTIKLVLRC